MTYSNQDFYDAIAETQAYVANEIDLVNLYHKSSSIESQQYDHRLQSFYLHHKAYFTQHLLLSLDQKAFKTLFSDATNKLNREVLCSVKSTLLPTHASDPPFTLTNSDLSTFINSEKNPLIHDVITFSIVPTLFNFFILPQSEEQFFEFLHQLEPSKFDIYARVLFVTPQFVRFVHKSFYPLFQGRLNSSRRGSHIRLITDITPFINSWKANAPLHCPAYISRLLQESPNSLRTFCECFMTPFLKEPQRWHVWDAWDEGCETERQELKRHFTPNSIICQFVTIITKCSDLYSPKFSENLEKVAPNGWHTYVLSTIDHLIVDIMRKGGKDSTSFKLPKNYGVSTVYRVGENIPKSLAAEAAAHQTPTGELKSDLATFLREVLKKSRYFPMDEIVSEEVDLLELLKSFLVGKASLKDQPEQQILLKKFENVLHERRTTIREAITDLKSFTNMMKYAHDEQADIFHRSARLDREMKAIKSVLKKSSNAVRTFVQVRNFTLEEIKPPSPEESIYDPEHFTLSLFSRFNALHITEDSDRHLYFHLFSREIEFLTYRCLNPSLRPLDNRFNGLATADIQKAINCHSSSGTFKEAFSHIEVFAKLGQRFISVFEENVDALTMSIHVNDIFNKAIRIYAKNCRLGSEFGADPITELLQFLLCCFPPKKFISGLWFMRDFVHRSGSTAVEPLQNIPLVQDLYWYAGLIMGKVQPGPGWWRSRGMMRKKKIAIPVPVVRGKITGIHAEVISLLGNRSEWSTRIDIDRSNSIKIRFEIVSGEVIVFIVDAVIGLNVRNDAKVSVWFDDGKQPRWLQERISGKNKGIVVSEKRRNQFNQFPHIMNCLVISLVDERRDRTRLDTEGISTVRKAEDIVEELQNHLEQLLSTGLYDLI
jgi:hypothetical protein